MLKLGMMALIMLAAATPVWAQYEETEVHLFVELPPEINALTAAEFRVDNLPYDYCYITEEWASPLTIGDIGESFAIAFIEPQPGPWVFLGTLGFAAFGDVGDDYRMEVEQTLDSYKLIIVDDFYQEIDAIGGWHTFNCSDPVFCTCIPYVREYPLIELFTDMEHTHCYQDLPVVITPADGSNWSTVKALY